MKRLIREVLATHREDRVVRWVASAQTSSSNFPVQPLSETHARLYFTQQTLYYCKRVVLRPVAQELRGKHRLCVPNLLPPVMVVCVSTLCSSSDEQVNVRHAFLCRWYMPRRRRGFELCSRKSKWRSRGGGEHCGFYGRCFHYSTGCKHIQTEQNHTTNPDIPHARVHFFMSTIYPRLCMSTDNCQLSSELTLSQATLTSFPNIVMRGFIGEVIQE